MKPYILPSFLLFALLLTGCMGPDSTPEEPEEAGNPNAEQEVQYLLEGTETTMETGEDPLMEETTGDIVACREQNTELSLELDTLEKRNAELQEALQEAQGAGEAAVIPEKYLEMIRASVLTLDQAEYPFQCGTVGSFLRSSWYDDFDEALGEAQIRFSNGYLESTDLFNGCYSAEGDMAFFLGAEREEDIAFFVIKYDTAEQELEEALLLDGADEVIIDSLGSREGPYILLSMDNGETYEYYYDVNIVLQK